MGSEYGGSEVYDDPGSVALSQAEDWGEGGTDWGTDAGYEGYYEGGEEGEDGILDQELAAALLEDISGSQHTGQSEDDDVMTEDSESDDDDNKSEYDEETLEKRAKIKQFTAEIKALEAVIDKKRAGFTGGNPIMVKRFEESIAGLQADVTAKIVARQALVDELGKAEGVATLEAAKQTGQVAKFAVIDSDERERKESTVAETPMDVDMDEEGYEETATLADKEVEGKARASSPQYSEDDGLFSDDDEEDGEDDIRARDGTIDTQPEAKDDDDAMSRLLQIELDGLDPNAIDGTTGLVLNQDQTDAEAAAALNHLAMTADFGGFPSQNPPSQDPNSMTDFDFSGIMDNRQEAPIFTEGGVGQRRWAVGVKGGEVDDESSADSDD
nr:hypothetical protein L203_05537 [Cryptococcus depauperatus CBS 7841]